MNFAKFLRTTFSQNTSGRLLLPNEELDWNIICILPRNVVVNSYLRNFQHKMRSYTLYLNKKLFLFNKITLLLCSFCKIHEEIVPYLSSESPYVKQLCYKLKALFITDFSHHRLPILVFRLKHLILISFLLITCY